MSTRLIAILALVLTLLIGVLVGLMAGRVLMPPPDRHPRAGPRALNEDFFVRRMQRALDVTDEQRDTVKSLLLAHSEQFLALHQRQAEETALLMDSLLAQLRGVLTEEQVSRFEERMHERRLRRGPRPPRGP